MAAFRAGVGAAGRLLRARRAGRALQVPHPDVGFRLARPTPPPGLVLSLSSLLSSLELRDTQVYEPYIRALLGTASAGYHPRCFAACLDTEAPSCQLAYFSKLLSTPPHGMAPSGSGV